MNRFSSVRLSIVMAAALGVSTLAGDALAVERPHSFRGYGTLTQLDFVSDGHATHLGKFHEVGSIMSLVPTGDPGVFQIFACAVHTAADGSELHEAITGQLNMLTGVANATVTYLGGTGRFRNASGTATLQLQMAPDGSFRYSGKGTIDF